MCQLKVFAVFLFIHYTLSENVNLAIENTNRTKSVEAQNSNSTVTTEKNPFTNRSIAYTDSVANTARPTKSFVSAFYNGADPNQIQKQSKTSSNTTTDIVWTDQLRRILANHNQGNRILIIMRGVSGSGKSYLAKQIIEITVGASNENYANHIGRSDDFFMVGGQYQYDKRRLEEAHIWNQNRVRTALIQGISPIIVDSTNLALLDMEPYVRDGVHNGYIIELVEPTTSWMKNVNQLARRNKHNVSIDTIKRMLEKYEAGLSGQDLLKYFGLSYPPNMEPPIVRKIPLYINQTKKQCEIKPFQVKSQAPVIGPSNQTVNQASLF